MRTVFRPLVPRMEDGLRLLFRRIPSSPLFNLCVLCFTASIMLGQNGVSCYADVRISINSGSPTRLDVGHLTPRSNTTGITVTTEDNRSDLNLHVRMWA